MARKARIGCIGDLLVEFVCTSNNGHHARAGAYSGPYPSGAPGIFIDQAARCGAAAIFVGAVGDDAFGHVVLERLAADGVDISLVRVAKGFPTGTAFVSYNDDGSRDFVFNIDLSAAGQFDADAPTLAALRAFNLDVMHVSGSALGGAAMRGKVLAACRAMYDAGVAITLDPNVRKELTGDPGYFDALQELMNMCAIFLPSEDDVDVLFPGCSLADMATQMFARKARHVVLKKGAAGCEAMSRDGERVALAAHKVEAADPTGAGDCFCATFVTLVTAGAHNLRQTLERANAAGALAVTAVGPMEGNRFLKDIDAFLAERA